MDLVNQTPVVADVRVATLDGTPHRYGLLVAKATFEVLQDGSTRLDSQDPFPLYDEDEPTELGVLPHDDVPRQDRKLEVIVLGKAYGTGRPQMLVELAVGAYRQSLLVSGDRWWTSHQGGGRHSSPSAFESIPLTWDRAYGGTAECWIDADSVIDLDHQMNKYGRGFNAYKLAEDVGKAFASPAGYPQLSPDYHRLLPNIEHPQTPIKRWTDEPRPYCWATMPTDIGAHLQRAHDYMAHHGQPLTQEEMLRIVYHRAHPDWIIDVPPIDTVVALSGMTKGPRFAFRIPRLRLLADYELGERTGTRELEPQLMMLLPEQSRFYLVYRHFFTIEAPTKDMSRSWRLRLAEGWIQA
ncbi:hypothetical protein ENSA5_51510 [Enhygromyxa salina]|uniref:DUF2169 domain-containing protein n=2 Tax=Enhygromyxa salina TaxID=215803 RepID=A0A2S9XHG2_9BACT|nr:hypothetical protein ENSA5_51510 [Enhygromyxa salina]